MMFSNHRRVSLYVRLESVAFWADRGIGLRSGENLIWTPILEEPDLSRDSSLEKREPRSISPHLRLNFQTTSAGSGQMDQIYRLEVEDPLEVDGWRRAAGISRPKSYFSLPVL